MRSIYKKISAFLLSLIISVGTSSPIYSKDEIPQVNVKINAYGEKRLISQYIYGIDDTLNSSNIRALALKQGGSRYSTYNWESNFSNWGSKFYQTSDDSLINGTDGETPGAPVKKIMEKAESLNVPFVSTTIPIGSYVAADSHGPVLTEEVAPSERWLKLEMKKNNVLSLSPDKEDEFVYIDEYINYLTTKYSNAQNSKLKLFFLDDEPDLWNRTHPAVFSTPTRCEDLIKRSVEAATIIKDLNEGAIVAGGAFSGIKGAATFDNAIDWNLYSNQYNWYIDFYLDQIKKASGEKRLIDILDMHYYSEHSAKNHKDLSICVDDSSECREARMQAARSLWDSSFTENSSSATLYRQYFPIIPTLYASINTYYPGTKLSFSEYNFGGGSDISGGIAEADVLGIFARENVYMASLKTVDQNIDYQVAGMNLYTNYDGNGSMFGNTYIPSTISDNINSSVYSSIKDGDDTIMKIVLINKSVNESINYNLDLKSQKQYNSAEIYGFDSTSSEITKRDDIKNIKSNKFNYTLTPMTAVIIVLNSTTVNEDILDKTSYSEATDITSVSASTSKISNTVINTSTAHISDITSASYTHQITEIVPDTEIKKYKFPTFLKVIVLCILGLVLVGIIYLFFDDFQSKRTK